MRDDGKRRGKLPDGLRERISGWPEQSSHSCDRRGSDYFERIQSNYCAGVTP
jgi:hypothetical protein